LSRSESSTLVESVIDHVAAALEKGEHVKLAGFGTFSLRDKKERIGRNPKTGEEVPITPRRVLIFKPSQVLRERVDSALSRKILRARMSQPKTTRAFRTISEAGEELGLQPHVLRFWESKFSNIKPIKRGGGRRFYRPEDIEFIRGIKKLLHDEKHPIKDVQKLIQKKGASRVVELGRSMEKAARAKPVAETDLLPKRIKTVEKTKMASKVRKPIFKAKKATPPPMPQSPAAPASAMSVPNVPVATGLSDQDRLALEEALTTLQSLKSKLTTFRKVSTVT